MTSDPHTSARSSPLLLLGAATLVLVASLADSWAYTHFFTPGVDSHDWGRLLRVMGFLPLWWVVGTATGLSHSSSGSRRGALLLMAAPTLAGALDEILKLLVRRERPGPNDGEYVFRSFTDRPFSTRGLGMPSSHAIVAFAAATILSRLWPRARPIWYGLAAGCALTRVMSRAHFLSDVVVGALAGWAVASLLWRAYSLPSPSSAGVSAL
jgi:membrane-associated phospholipid phosphatase